MPYLGCIPCAPLLGALFNRAETELPLDFQGRVGIISIVRWNLRPIIFGVGNCNRAVNSEKFEVGL